MHGRSPTVERLYFHLENQQPVYWTDNQQIGEVLSQNTIKESMFTAWMHSNKTKYALMGGILLSINMSQDLFMLPAKDASNQENKEIQ